MEAVYKLSTEDQRQIEEIDKQIARLVKMKVDIYARSQMAVPFHNRRSIEKTIQEQSFLCDQKILDSLRIANLVFEDANQTEGAVYNGDI